MEHQLKKQTVSIARTVLDRREECALCVDYTLPDYCPDVAVVLKCMVSPRVQNRQWSGDRLLVDGTADVRVLYLDEERRCVRAVEFSQPLSCSLAADGYVDDAVVRLDLSTKYVNCRAVGPRRLEVRGVVTVEAEAEGVAEMTMMAAGDEKDLYTRCETVTATTPMAAAQRILTVNESLDFPDDLPPAELLLGGDCRAVMRECKLLAGKAILKGEIYIHHLYTDNTETGTAYCLDYTLPFSQILDVEGAQEGQLYTAHVLLLSDTQRCAVGQKGSNTVLEVAVKLLLQVQTYDTVRIPLLLDAYHSRCPITTESKECRLCACMGNQWEMAVLPMQMDLPTGGLQELVDVWIQPHTLTGTVVDGSARLAGRLLICMLVRDTDGQIAYYERPEEYGLEFTCQGNDVCGKSTVAGCKYRATEDKLELQVSLHVTLSPCRMVEKKAISGVRLHSDQPYPRQRATALLYYAEAGETVWDIGRCCHTSPACIREENGLIDDCLHEASTLVVPLL